jgi:hypothetical protein
MIRCDAAHLVGSGHQVAEHQGPKKAPDLGLVKIPGQPQNLQIVAMCCWKVDGCCTIAGEGRMLMTMAESLEASSQFEKVKVMNRGAGALCSGLSQVDAGEKRFAQKKMHTGSNDLHERSFQRKILLTEVSEPASGRWTLT